MPFNGIFAKYAMRHCVCVMNILSFGLKRLVENGIAWPRRRECIWVKREREKRVSGCIHIIQEHLIHFKAHSKSEFPLQNPNLIIIHFYLAHWRTHFSKAAAAAAAVRVSCLCPRICFWVIFAKQVYTMNFSCIQFLHSNTWIWANGIFFSLFTLHISKMEIFVIPQAFWIGHSHWIALNHSAK